MDETITLIKSRPHVEEALVAIPKSPLNYDPSKYPKVFRKVTKTRLDARDPLQLRPYIRSCPLESRLLMHILTICSERYRADAYQFYVWRVELQKLDPAELCRISYAGASFSTTPAGRQEQDLSKDPHTRHDKFMKVMEEVAEKLKVKIKWEYYDAYGLAMDLPGSDDMPAIARSRMARVEKGAESVFRCLLGEPALNDGAGGEEYGLFDPARRPAAEQDHDSQVCPFNATNHLTPAVLTTWCS